jgi:hypothetical protein
VKKKKTPGPKKRKQLNQKTDLVLFGFQQKKT